MKNKKTTYSTLRRIAKLEEERSPLYTQGKVAKFLAYFSVALTAIYLLFLSITLSLAAHELRRITAYEFIFCLLPFLCALDFGIRFVFQNTPAQQVKPFILLPVKRMECIDYFVIQQLRSSGNLIWMILYVPFAIMSIVFVEGIGTTLLFLLALFLIELIVNQLYSITRSLINSNALWTMIVVPLALLIFLPAFFCSKFTFDSMLTALTESYSKLGYLLCNANILAWGALIAVLAIIIQANRMLQYRFVYSELTTEPKHVKANTSISESKYGIIGKLAKIEVLSIRRNKNVRKAFLTANIIILLFSLICAFTPVYDDLGMTHFWIIYNFDIIGMMSLLRIMTFEGNYIEALIIGHNTLKQLLTMKYYVYTAYLIVPFIMMMPMVFEEKVTFLTLFAFLIFTAGPIHLLYLTFALYNKQTQPLNEKFNGKMKIENNWRTVVAQIICFSAPLAIFKILTFATSETVAGAMICAIGFIFIALHKRIINAIYKKLMEKKYDSLASMIATRE